MQLVKEGKDYHPVDCGIAMAHLELAADALGLTGYWDLNPRQVPGSDSGVEYIGRFVFHEDTVVFAQEIK